MLILSRKIGESLVIGDDENPAAAIPGSVTVTIISIQGNQVKLGISAPREVPVDREEIRRMKKSFARKNIISVRQVEQVE